MGFIFQSYASSTWAVPVNSKVWTENIFFFIIFFSFFFKIWIFRVIRWVKGQKKWPKKTKNYHSCSLYLRNIHHMILVFVTRVEWWYLQHFFFFFIFSKFWFFWFLGGQKGKKDPNCQFRSVTLYISGTVYHIIEIFGLQV